MTPGSIRAARADDLDGLLALYRELRPQDPRLPSGAAQGALERLLARDDIHLLVCEAGEALVATCMLAIIPNLASEARPFGVIEHVVTLQAHRARGHARRIMERALELAWAADCYKVLLLSGTQRVSAHKLYESLGFNGDVERGFVIKPGGKPRA